MINPLFIEHLHILLEAGVSPNAIAAPSYYSRAFDTEVPAKAALAVATKHDNVPAMELLVVYGASLEPTDDSFPPISYSPEVTEKTISFLIFHGADIYKKRYGSNAIDLVRDAPSFHQNSSKNNESHITQMIQEEEKYKKLHAPNDITDFGSDLEYQCCIDAYELGARSLNAGEPSEFRTNANGYFLHAYNTQLASSFSSNKTHEKLQQLGSYGARIAKDKPDTLDKCFAPKLKSRKI